MKRLFYLLMVLLLYGTSVMAQPITYGIPPSLPATTFTGDVTIGSTSEGHNLTINATEGAELSPALTGASTVNWTFAGTYTTPLNSTIEKAGDGTDTITPTAATTIVAGVTYKVVITTSACTVGGFSYTLGGVTGTSFSTATTVTDYITATTTGKLIITPTATSSRFVISSISFKALTDATGDLTVRGNLTVNSPATFNGGIANPELKFGLGGVLYSLVSNNVSLFEGSTYANALYTATETESSQIHMGAGNIELFVNSGLTPGSAFTPNRVGYFTPGEIILETPVVIQEPSVSSLTIRTTQEPTAFFTQFQQNYDADNWFNIYAYARNLLKYNYTTNSLSLMPTGNLGIGTPIPRYKNTTIGVLSSLLSDDGTNYEGLTITPAAGSVTLGAVTAGSATDNIAIILAPAGTGAVKVSSEFNGATVSNQFSNRLSGDLLGISTAPKFINTLLGTPATDAANMIDVSGAGHNGTYKGTWAASQRINKGMGWVLNPNATDNYIDLGDSNDFTFSTGDLTDIAFTIAGVIEVVNTATNQMIFSKLDTTTGSTKREYNLYLGTDETLTMQFYDESVPVQVNRITNAALSVGFHSFTITYDGGGGATAANGITIYVDGAVVASTAANDASYVAMENTTTSFWIGSRVSTGGTPEYFMQGDFTPPLIDKGYVWSAATVNRFHQYMKGIFNL